MTIEGMECITPRAIVKLIQEATETSGKQSNSQLTHAHIRVDHTMRCQSRTSHNSYNCGLIEWDFISTAHRSE